MHSHSDNAEVDDADMMTEQAAERCLLRPSEHDQTDKDDCD